MKKCCTCKVPKELTAFYGSRKTTDGVHAECKECIRARAKRWQHEHPEEVNAKTMRWAKKNLHKRAAIQAARRAARVSATPGWANDVSIQDAYKLAEHMTKTTGIAWTVDHVVPLKSRIVCGLHVEHNLQVIPASRNYAKGNRQWPEMP